MRLFAGALRVAALLLLAACSFGQDSESTDDSRSTDPCQVKLNNNVQGTNCSSSPTVASTTQSTATSISGALTTATQPTNGTTSVPTNTQSVKTSKTIVSTTVSPVTSSQLNITMTTSRFSSASVTAAPKSEAVIAKTSGFHVGSFIGGIGLTLGILLLLYLGCKTYRSRTGIQYRTIDEHDAII
ncbi:porimin isoform X1 [Dromaius novaehollandiae]|uniref:porimin isoform X1 n=1 Tax=Dromaius novaehollandiae TaxID=8790 RepID=UPI00311E2F0F